MSAESSQDAPAGPGVLLGARFGPVLVSLCLLGAGWLLVRLTQFEYGLDQGIYATVADVMREGGVPYRDAWDFKPPGIFLVYAAAKAMFGDTMAAVRWLEALLWASLAVAFALHARRLLGSVWPGLLGAALATSGHVWMGFWHTAQPESFGAVLVAWALAATTVDPHHPRRFAADVAVAALYACAALLKPPLGGGILVSFVFALRGGGSRRQTALAYAVGGALPPTLTLLYFAATGALGEMAEALLVFAPEYTALNYRGGDLSGFLLRAVKVLFLRFSWLNALGLLLLVALPRRWPREREGALHVALVMLVCVFGVALQGRFFAYHYGAAVPLLALLAGWGWFKLVRLGERAGVGVVATAVAFLALANANGVSGPVEGGFLQRVRSVDDGRAYNVPQRHVADWLRANTAPDATLHVFGFQPVLYDLADRRPASRFVYNAAQRAPWYSARGRDALMEDLQRTPPDALLVEKGDLHPGTGGTGFDSATTLGRFPRLGAFLERGYDAGREVGSFTVYLRREATPGPPPGRASRPGPEDPAASP
ncbi:MAG: hypothetical protein ACQGVC_22010 [Myxococcota bacterium]